MKRPATHWQHLARLLQVIPLIPASTLLFSDPQPAVSPQIFAAVGGGTNSLLLSGFLGLCKVLACLFFILFLVERIGRRGSMLAGSFLMGVYMLIIAVLTATHPPNPDAGLTPSSIAAITMILLEASEYSAVWCFN